MSVEVAYAAERFRAVVHEPSPAPPSTRDRFEAMLDRHDRQLRRVVAGVIADRDRVDDVLQDAYVKAYRKLPERFASPAHEATWLYRVVYRTALDELRRLRRSREQPASDVLHRVAVSGNAETRLHLVECFRALPDAERAALVLVVVVGFDYATAAEILGVPLGTVAWRVNAARGHFAAGFRGEERT